MSSLLIPLNLIIPSESWAVPFLAFKQFQQRKATISSSAVIKSGCFKLFWCFFLGGGVYVHIHKRTTYTNSAQLLYLVFIEHVNLITNSNVLSPKLHDIFGCLFFDKVSMLTSGHEQGTSPHSYFVEDGLCRWQVTV